MASHALPNRPPNPASFGPRQPPQRAPLAPGWTEHKAPTGHSYYYNASTKISTYTRPVAQPHFVAPPAPGPYPTFAPSSSPFGRFPQKQQFPPQNYNHGRGGGFGGPFGGRGRGGFNHSRGSHNRHSRRQEKPDRPKSKRVIPTATPWVLVTTKLGRKFVHNTETKESLWKAPEDIQAAIDAMPEEEVETREQRRLRKAEKAKAKEAKAMAALEKTEKKEDIENDIEGPRGTKRSASAALEVPGRKMNDAEDGGEEEEYEEEEEEEEYEEDEDEEGHEDKKMRTEDGARPVEFTEDDVAWQLEAMAEEYGLEEDLEGEELGEEDSLMLFREMLSEHNANPYSTWETEMPNFVEDTRYTLINTTKARKDIFMTWCRDRIVELKAEKQKERKIDPKLPFWAFLKENANAKLYWPEFKRKWKKVPEMKDSKVPEKEREKMYRDYVARIKSSEGIRENDLKKLLKSTTTLSRNTTLDTLPDSILTDVRYITAPEKTRDEIITNHLATLPEVPMSESERKELEEHQRKHQALRERERTVRRDQWRLRGEMEQGREVLREEEAMIERAKIVTKKGLLGHIIKKEEGEVVGGEENKEVS